MTSNKRTNKLNPRVTHDAASNTNQGRLDDASPSRGDLKTTNNASKYAYNMGMHEVNKNCSFRRDMSERAVLINLFMLEGEPGFSRLTVREQMTECVRKGNDEMRDWLFSLGVENRLPEDWDQFKEMLKDFCSGEGLEGLTKYNDEPWSAYLRRLKDSAEMKNIPSVKVLEKVRNMNVPRDLKLLFNIFDGNLPDLIQKTRSLEARSADKAEEFISLAMRDGEKPRTKMQSQFNRQPTKSSETRKCYKCQKIGHIARNCRLSENNRSVQHLGDSQAMNKSDLSYSTKYKSTDERIIDIQGQKTLALFDSGASNNFISNYSLGQLKHSDIKKYPEPKMYDLVGGNKLQVTHKIKLLVEYAGQQHSVDFEIIDENKPRLILGYATYKAWQEVDVNNGKFECSIHTNTDKIISWNRSIKNNRDKSDFLQLIKDLEQRNIIEPSRSMWLNPVVLTRKNNGKLRFCVDFRRLNEIVDLDQYEIPRIQELINMLYSMKYFSTLDLKDGFYQVPLRKEDRQKTAFLAGGRLFQFKVMPQGFKNSPAIFQRFMNNTFQDMIGKRCLIYIDDILVFGKDKQEHDENLKSVLQRLKECNLIENMEKRVECQTRIKFLGYLIEENSIYPTTERCQGIKTYTEPRTRKQLQRFLGMCNYDRAFVQNLSEKAKILYEVVAREKFKWDETASKTFKEIQNIWSRQLMLKIPQFDKEFTLETDASDLGLGGVLKQGDEVIAYISRLLNKQERNYTITEREVLAILWSLEKLENIIGGRKISVITDHKAIEAIKDKVDFGTRRIQRWHERLARFDFTAKYKPAENLVQPDALSRGASQENGDAFIQSVKNIEDEIMKIHNEHNHRKVFCLYKKIVPAVTRKEVQETIKKCVICKRRLHNRKHKGNFVQTRNPGDLVGCDFIVLSNQKYIITGIDYFSRYGFATLLDSRDERHVIKFIDKMNKNLRIKCIRFDNAKEFKGKKLHEFCARLGIIVEYSVPYYHESNGRVERFNRTVREALNMRKAITNVSLQKAIRNYNSIFHRAINCCPLEALNAEKASSILEHQEKYAKEFVRTKCKAFEINDTVLVKNFNKKNKDDYNYLEQGRITKILGDLTYELSLDNGKKLIRHSSHLRKLEGVKDCLKKGDVGNDRCDS